MMRRIGWALLCCFGAMLAASPIRAADIPSGGAALAPTNASYTPVSERLDPAIALSRINAFRAEAGAPPLSLDAALTQAAFSHARDLAGRDAISHFGRDGSTPPARVAAAGYDAVLTGENVAIGQRSFDEVLAGWEASPAHRATLLAPTAVNAGLALVYNPDASYRTFWTMVVAEPF